MKKIVFAVLTSIAAMGASAVEADTVLSVTQVTIDGNQVALPTTKKADGTVCTAYVAETHRDGRKLAARIDQRCVASH